MQALGGQNGVRTDLTAAATTAPALHPATAARLLMRSAARPKALVCAVLPALPLGLVAAHLNSWLSSMPSTTFWLTSSSSMHMISGPAAQDNHQPPEGGLGQAVGQQLTSRNPWRGSKILFAQRTSERVSQRSLLCWLAPGLLVGPRAFLSVLTPPKAGCRQAGSHFVSRCQRHPGWCCGCRTTFLHTAGSSGCVPGCEPGTPCG